MAPKFTTPDPARYLFAGAGNRVGRPFNLRVLLPLMCRDNLARWWTVWVISWPVAAIGMTTWRLGAGDSWQIALAATALLLALPGILGPASSIPVQVDLPATAVMLLGVSLFENGLEIPGVIVVAVSASIRETQPVWASLLLWNPLPLIALIVPAVVRVLRPPLDYEPLDARFDIEPSLQWIADFPLRAGLLFHQNAWRNGWLLVYPWGACLAALWAPEPQIVIILILAYAQLLVATDTVRLYQHAAGPAMAALAASNIPESWLLVVIVFHTMWWRKPERI